MAFRNREAVCENQKCSRAEEYNDPGLEPLRNGDAKNAAPCFAKAVQLNPEYGPAWYGKDCGHGELGEIR